MKLDGADVLKTISSVVQRGYFDIHASGRTPIMQVLWGSRDLYRWEIITSSTQFYMRGYRGTPFKYFVLGAVCDLTAEERLSGVSIEHQPRYLNKVR
jgi:hypothetical protein